MSKFSLNTSQAQHIELSNDAFFYLYQEEDMIDESNMDEALSILAKFPNGYVINDDWYYSDNEGFINATFIPYTEDKFEFDYEFQEPKDWAFQFNILSKDRLYGRSYNKADGRILDEGEWPIEYFHKKPWAVLRKQGTDYSRSVPTQIPIFKAM